MATSTEKQLMLTLRTSGSRSQIKLFIARMLAFICVLLCLVFGLAGLLLPVIPGLLFLVLALMIAARHIPSLDRCLRRNRTLSTYLDSGQGFFRLGWLQKIQYIFYLCLKICIDTLALLFTFLFKLLGRTV